MMRPQSRAFTLIEILAVLAIVGILAVLAIPAATSIMRGSNLSRSLDLVATQLSLARQYAVTKNVPVEVRFYALPARSGASSQSAFRAIQSFGVTPGAVFLPLEKPQFVPATTILSGSPVLSTLLDPGKRTKISSAPSPFAGAGGTCEYLALRFLPNGSTDLLPTAGPWTVTLHDESAGDNLASVPPNYAAIEVDPVTGGLKIFRP